MSRFRFIAPVTMLIVFATAMFSQQSAPAGGTDKQEHSQSAFPDVDQHVKLLSEKLNLTAEQQDEIRPIVKQMMDETQKLKQDTSLSDEARHEKRHALHEKAKREVRKYLNDDQKKKLDELESQPHH